MEALHIVTEFGSGNFDVNIKQLPGKKEILTTSFKAVQSNLKKFNSDINGIIQGSIEGNLDISMKIKTGNDNYIIPIVCIRQSLKVKQENLFTDSNGNEMITIKGEVYNLVKPYNFLRISTDVTNIEDGIIIMLEYEGNSLCIFVDDIIGEQTVTVSALPEYIGKTKGIIGCTLFNDNEINLIIDIFDFFENENGKKADEFIARNTGMQLPEQISHDDINNDVTTKDKYFTFEIDNEEYGIEVANIKELISVCQITRVPEMPDYIEGL